MAEESKNNFGGKIESYADMYENAIKENAQAFMEIAVVCIEKGLVTSEKVLNDAKRAGIDFTKEKLDQMRGIKESIKQKAEEVKENVTDKAKEAKYKVVEVKENVTNKARETKSKVVDKAGEVKESITDKAKEAKYKVVEVKENVTNKARETKSKVVDKAGKVREGVTNTAKDARDAVKSGVDKAGHAVIEGVAMTAAVPYMAGRAGAKLVVKGAKTIQGTEKYKAAKGTAEKAFQKVSSWFKARGKNIKDFGKAVKDTPGKVKESVTDKAIEAKDKVVEVKENVTNKARETKKKVVDKAEEAKDKVVETKENVTSKAREAKKKVVDKAGKVKEGVTNTAKDARDAVKSGVDKAGHAVIEGVAMTAAVPYMAGRAGAKLVVKGAKTIQGTEKYKAAKGTAEKAFQKVSSWFKARGKNIKDFGKAVKDTPGKVKESVTDKAIEAKGKVVDVKENITNKARDAKDAVVTKAGAVKDDIAYDLGTASNRVQSRINTKISNMSKSGREFMNNLFDKLDKNAKSKEEKLVEAQKERDSQRKDSKEQDNEMTM